MSWFLRSLVLQSFHEVVELARLYAQDEGVPLLPSGSDDVGGVAGFADVDQVVGAEGEFDPGAGSGRVVRGGADPVEVRGTSATGLPGGEEVGVEGRRGVAVGISVLSQVMDQLVDEVARVPGGEGHRFHPVEEGAVHPQQGFGVEEHRAVGLVEAHGVERGTGPSA